MHRGLVHETNTSAPDAGSPQVISIIRFVPLPLEAPSAYQELLGAARNIISAPEVSSCCVGDAGTIMLNAGPWKIIVVCGSLLKWGPA